MPSPNEILKEAVAVSKFKIEWAKQHIEFIKQLVERVRAENVDVVTIDNDTNPARVTIGPRRFLDVNFFLLAGDTVHNINSVTDYLWTALDRAAHEVLNISIDHHAFSRTSFPRHGTWQNLSNDVEGCITKGTAIYVAFPQAKRFILNEIKPTKRANGPSFIWSLNKLDNINKHRFFLAAAHVLAFEDELQFVGGDGGRFIQSRGSSIKTQGYPLAVGLTSPVKLENQPKAIVDVIFTEQEHFTGEPVLETLVNLTNAVSELVKLFEETFL